VIDPALPRPPSIVDALRVSVERYPASRALVCRGRVLTYSQLGRCVLDVAGRLSALGVAGQRVALLMPTSIEAVVTILAALAAGAELMPINPFFTSIELEAVLLELDPHVIVCGGEAWDKLQALAPSLAPRRVVSFGQIGGGAAIAEADRADPLDWSALRPVHPDAPAVAILTGGTTGEPKAVEHTHRSLMVSVLQHCSVWRVRPGAERFLSAAPVFHIWGLFYATFVPLYVAGTLVLVPRYDPEEVLAAIELERITVFGGGPAPVYLGLLGCARLESTNFSSLVYCLSGGAPCPLDLHQRWRAATGCALLEGWGMSEAAPLCLSRPEAHKPLSVGRAVPETQIEVVDVDSGGRVLAAGEPGEVRVRGPQMMRAYRGRPDATRAVLRAGWLYTGDIGYLDADGDLFLVDRKKDMIIVGGYNVYPRQVDEVLYRHPAIAEAATVGRADERLGEVLVAFVVIEPGVSLDERGFFAFCEQQLIKYRRPVSVTFLPSLPRTMARKIDKKLLRAMAEGRSGSTPA
jgi:long-chain acyl-CoA synthetase